MLILNQKKSKRCISLSSTYVDVVAEQIDCRFVMWRAIAYYLLRCFERENGCQSSKAAFLLDASCFTLC